MDCADHVTSHAPYMGICECAASGKLCRFSGSSSSDIRPSASQVVSSVGDGSSGLAGVSGLESVCEDRSMMFKTYSGPLPIHPRWHELP